MKLPITMKRLLGAIFALGLVAVSSLHGQSITTSSINGTVMNDGGQLVPNARVSVTHEPTGASYEAITRADGRFTLRGLRPGGPYTVATTLPGSIRLEQRDVELDIDNGADVTLRQKAGQVVTLEAFQVTAAAADNLFDPNQTGSGSYLTSADIRNLPVGDRSINGLARLDPRISYNRDPQDRAISVNGMSNRFNSIQVDGVSASDPFGLNANNTAAERNVVPMDSLEALSVSTAPYNARNAGFVGAQINAITKSGSNQFHGTAYFTYRDESLVAGELDGRSFPLPNFKEKTMGGTLGGPIIPKRLFFYTSYEKVDEDRVAPSPVARLDAATTTQIINAAQALGFTPGTAEPPSANKLTDDNFLIKADAVINANHRATFRYTTVESSRPTFEGFGTGISENNISLSSYWYQQNVKNTSYIGQLVSRWSDRLNTELSVSRSNYHSEPKNNTRQPGVQVRNVPVPGSSNTSFVNFGTQISRHANILDVATDTTELFASYELGDRHTLQAGFQFDTADIYNLFVQNANGSYDFNSLAEFLAVAARNDGTVNYRQYTYNQINPGVEPAARFSEANAGLFVNDVWRFNSNLTMNVGFRVDMPLLPDAVPFNQTLLNTFGVRNDHTYDGVKVFQPRFGFNYRAGGDTRAVVRGGIGLFYGRAPRVWISNSYSNTGSNFRTFTAGTTPGGQAPRVSASPDTQVSTASVPPAQTVAFLDPDFELPSRYKANIAFERGIDLWNIKIVAEFEKTWVNQDVFYQNINLAPTRTGPDGRQLYWNAFAANSSGTRLVSTAFTNRLIKLGNTDQGGTNTMSLSFEKPRSRSGWSWKAAYVHNKADEVLFGTSSVAASNWNNRAIFNTNVAEKHRSELEIRNKVLVNIAKDFELAKGYRTSVGLLYELRTGYPFSFVFTGDTNGDSQTQNDLAYIPLRGGDPLVRFATPADRDRFFAIVDQFGLTEGRAVEAGSNNYPTVSQFDLSIKQDVKLPFWRHKLVLGMDVLNLGNLLNEKWGLIRGSNQFFIKREGIAAAAYDGVANQYVYSNVSTTLPTGSFSPSLGRGEPAATRWSMLLSARYEF